MENSELNKLGQKLEIYTVVDYIGKGFPIILPNGAKIIRTIRNFVEDEQERNRFYVVRTPSASRAEIYSIEDRLQLHTKKCLLNIVRLPQFLEMNEIQMES